VPGPRQETCGKWINHLQSVASDHEAAGLIERAIQTQPSGDKVLDTFLGVGLYVDD